MLNGSISAGILSLSQRGMKKDTPPSMRCRDKAIPDTVWMLLWTLRNASLKAAPNHPVLGKNINYSKSNRWNLGRKSTEHTSRSFRKGLAIPDARSPDKTQTGQQNPAPCAPAMQRGLVCTNFDKPREAEKQKPREAPWSFLRG